MDAVDDAAVEDRLLGLEPLPRVAQRQRPVTRWAPRQGWALASRPRRAFACATLVLAPVLFLGPFWHGWLAWLAATLGPPTYYSLARVLRPTTGRAGVAPDEQLLLLDNTRHLAAATATAFATPVLGYFFSQRAGWPDATAWPAALFLYLGVPAMTMGLVTLVWGALTRVRR